MEGLRTCRWGYQSLSCSLFRSDSGNSRSLSTVGHRATFLPSLNPLRLWVFLTLLRHVLPRPCENPTLSLALAFCPALEALSQICNLRCVSMPSFWELPCRWCPFPPCSNECRHFVSCIFSVPVSASASVTPSLTRVVTECDD